MRGEVLDGEPVLDFDFLEMGVDSLDGIHPALLTDEARLLPVGYHQRIIAVLDVLLEALVDFDNASFPGLLLVQHKGIPIQEH